MTKTVIINADDYGLTSAVSKGIREAFLNGILTSTTAMATGLSLEADLPLLFKECPAIGVGAHLTLTTLKPVLRPDQIPSLVNKHGHFNRLGDLIALADQINEDELYAEWKAQINKLLRLGLELDHLDSHHSAGIISEKTVEVMIRLAGEYGLPVRKPQSSHQNKAMDAYALAELDKHGIPYPKHFNGDFSDNKGTLESLTTILTELKTGTTEIMSHPGYVDADLENISSMVAPRLTELSSLCSAEAKQLVIDQHIKLATFGEAFKG